MNDLDNARTILDREGYTCVLCRGTALHTSRQRGVKPLLALLDEDVEGFSAADKVVGKGAALLYCLLKIKTLHAHIISEAALSVLQDHGIPASWDLKVPYIVNRAGTGRCPMEVATEHITEPALAPEAIRAALKKLQG